MHSKTGHSFKNKKLKYNFEPSMGTLFRILETMAYEGPKPKTVLSVDTHLNYSRLARHIAWLETKGLAESTIDESKINVGLTEKGKIFAKILSDTHNSKF